MMKRLHNRLPNVLYVRSRNPPVFISECATLALPNVRPRPSDRATPVEYAELSDYATLLRCSATEINSDCIELFFMSDLSSLSHHSYWTLCSDNRVLATMAPGTSHAKSCILVEVRAKKMSHPVVQAPTQDALNRSVHLSIYFRKLPPSLKSCLREMKVL